MLLLLRPPLLVLVLPLKFPLSIDDEPPGRSQLVPLLSAFMPGRSNRLLDHMGVTMAADEEPDELDTGRIPPPDDDTGDIPAIVC